MFANDKNIDNLQQLLAVLKKYAVTKGLCKTTFSRKTYYTDINPHPCLYIIDIRYYRPFLLIIYIGLCTRTSCRRAYGQLWNHYRMHYSADSVNRFIPQTADCSAYGKFPCQLAFK